MNGGATWMRVGLLGCCALLSGGSCQEELRDRVENEPGMGPAPPPLAPRFISPNIATEVHSADGTSWRLEARSDLSSVTNSVDLWISRNGGPPVFTGAMPSCYGRDPWVTDPRKPKDRSSNCYLGLFNVEDGNAVFKLYLAGGWQHTMRLPLAPAFRDTDGDGWNDALEVLLGTRPDVMDTDHDGRDDPGDDNPLAAQEVPRAVGTVQNPQVKAAREVVAAVVANLTPCATGKPLIIIGPKVAHQSFPHRTCQQIYLDEDSPMAVQRSMVLPVDGKVQKGDLVVAETAMAGGLPRVKIELKSVFVATAEVHVINMLGRIIKRMEKVDNAWRVESQEVVVATP